MRRSVVLAALGQAPPDPSLRRGEAARSATGGGFGPLLGLKPFRAPLSRSSTHGSSEPGGRKRKRVDYSGMDGATDDAAGDQNAEPGDDGDGGASLSPKRAKKKGKAAIQIDVKGCDEYGRSLAADNRKWGVFRPTAGAMRRAFRIPVMKGKKGEVIETRLTAPALGTRKPIEIPPRPLHDPMDDHAIVLFDPTVDDVEAEREKERLRREREEAEQAMQAGGDATEEPSKPPALPEKTPHKSLAEILGINRTVKKCIEKMPVVIDPRLGKILRPHQVEGVKFLYRCTTGLLDEKAHGCIMADEMGLGKTLQCITLMWTLLKQSPTPRKPTIEKCIVTCPSSLVRNWANELGKWLGNAAPAALALDGKLSKEDMILAVRRWADAQGRSITQPVLIASYETLRNIVTELDNCEIGLMLCDEGHRLKNSDSLTFTSLDKIKARRRVILSGTPIQNDLLEYFSLISFANSDLLGGRADFRKNFETPILRGRDASATDKQQQIGDEKLKELNSMVSKFMIRRTNDLLSKYLPVKYEHVVFCNMAPFQLELQRLFMRSPEIKKLLRGKESQTFKAITMLKKLCTHPSLLDLPSDLSGCEKLFPDGYNPKDQRNIYPEHSGKMVVLERFLHGLRRMGNDKVVLISNYTQTLDLFERMCRNNRWGCCRLDGSMAVPKRQKLVDRFNDPEGTDFIFLLSSKAGGCGINLIGANRLVLFDPDWNPASDQQALARVWRDGQKKDCFIYRFITTGSIEEKILQRQSHKQTLSSCVVDAAEDAERHFSGEDLKALFDFREQTLCDTHDTYKCKRCVDGKQRVKSKALLYGDTSTWNHYTNDELHNLHDDLLRAEKGQDGVSFVFQYCSQ